MHEWNPVDVTKKDNITSYRRFLNADPELMAAISFEVYKEDTFSDRKYGSLCISDCRKTITLELGVDDTPDSKERMRYKLDSIQEALNHLYDTLEV